MNLNEFLEKYQTQLVQTVENNLAPLYNPFKPEGVEEFEPKISGLLRTPFAVQREVIKGLAKAFWKESKTHLGVCGEMGCGKTFIALSVAAMSPRPLRTLVACPSHLVEKWMRQAMMTIPGVEVHDLALDNVLPVLHELKDRLGTRPQTHEVWVISKNKAKLGYDWRPAAQMKAYRDHPICPSCGEEVVLRWTKKKDENGKLEKDPDGNPVEIPIEWLTWEQLLEGNRRWACTSCGGALWQASESLHRFAPAEYIKRYLPNFWDMLIIDEIHQDKAGDTLYGRSSHLLMSSVQNSLCLTGTLSGGYADDVFYLLFRMDPATFRADGFDHNSASRWLNAYGIIERTIRIAEEGGERTQTVSKRPGTSPKAVGKYMLDKFAFIRLGDVVDGLPSYDEYVTVVELDQRSGQAAEYATLESTLRDVATREGMRHVTGSMIQALLCYPDSCMLFPESITIKPAQKTRRIRRSGAVQDPADEDAPILIEAPVLDYEGLLPKERELVNLVLREKQEERKVLCYLTYTGKRDVRPRLRKVLSNAGVRLSVIDTSVPTKKREQWIEEHAPHVDVLIANTELVSLGLDLYQFPTVVFYEVDYKVFGMRQAARRSWRIGQEKPVRVYFFCYGGTMQETALVLIARRLEAALLTEGDLPEGLAEYAAGGDSVLKEMGKALLDGNSYRGAEMAWANFRKKEIESQLAIGAEEISFTGLTDKGRPQPETTTVAIDANSIVRVKFVERTKRKRISVVEVRFGDIDTAAEGRPVQFTLF